ncbi:uncharacterized protein LOC130670622 isoform X1 [Microplitis mediator]|uniref:uncharacterized protein LOC130670622 isoform X1 n=1 Tax=Microplitis mediator TaxID=375433 RepID=UPI00255321DD|nr:uncharacterized protein LOC130670622 isoform X1 [Microplitis mediator]XP_057330035.1 uncharacterized protein LOC130670622 isoform X1 [Microplitis mediator]
MILPIAIVVITQSFGTQGTLHLVLEDAMCTAYDEEYFLEPETYVNDENAWVVNMTLIKPLSIETQGYFSLTGASMGEYVVNTGIEVQMSLCDFIEEPIIMGRVLQAFGLSVDDCPPKIGPYGTEGYIFPTDTLPDEFPPNKYMVEFGLSYEEKPLIVYQVFYNSQ